MKTHIQLLTTPSHTYKIYPCGRVILVLLIIISSFTGTLAQTKQWDKRFGGPEEDRLTTMVATNDGGYLIGGTSYVTISNGGGDKTDPGEGYDDYWVVRIDADGNKLWDQAYGGTENDNLTVILATADGGFLLGGSSGSGNEAGDKSENPRSCDPFDDFCHHDYWIIKIDANGNKLWDKTYGSIGYDNLAAIVPTADGGYLVGGTSTEGNGGDKSQVNIGGSDYWVVKIDANGNKVWDKVYGGNQDENLSVLIPTKDGNFLLGGTSESGVSGDRSQPSRGLTDYWIIKINTNGNKLWDKRYGGSEQDYLSSLIVTADNSYLLGGISYSGVSGDKTEGDGQSVAFWVINISDNGTKLWDKSYGSPYPNSNHTVVSMAATSDKGFLLTGNITKPLNAESVPIHQDYFIRKFNATGTELAFKTYGGDGNEYLGEILVKPNGDYLLGGYTNSDVSGDVSEASRGDDDYWVIKLQTEVTPPISFWNKRFGGKSTEILKAVVRAPGGGYLLGGHSLSRHGGNRSQDSRGGYDFWIVKTDAAGNQLWNKRYGGNNDDYLNGIIATQDGGYLLAGSSKSGLGGDKSQPSRGGQDFWIVKINSTGVKEWDRRYGGNGFDDLKSLIQLETGEFMLAGESDSDISGDKSQNRRGSRDYWIVKITSNGDTLWDKRYGGSRSETLNSIISTNYDYLLGGKSASGAGGDKSQASRGNYDFWLVRIDENGDKVWDKRFGGTGDDELTSMGDFAFGEVFIGGTSNSGANGDKTQESQGGKDYWLLQLNDYGGQIWDKTFGGTKDDELHNVFLDNNGNYLLAGSSASNVSDGKSEESQGGKDYWIVKLDGYAGDKIWDKRYGGAGDDHLRFALHTDDDAYLLAGYSASGISGDKSQNNQGRTDYWLTKVPNLDYPLFPFATRKAQTSTPETTKVLGIDLQAFPNPISEILTISFTIKKTQPVQLQVFNSRGQQVKTLFEAEAQANKNYQVAWKPTSNQTNGLYIIKLQAIDFNKFKKIILKR